LRQRIGKLMGGSAILQVGGITEREITSRKEMAERTAEALRGAVRDGVLPGAGASLLACRPALQRRLDQSTDPDERAAGRVLLRALEEPARAIITNAGYDASEVLAEIKSAPPGHGFDARCGQVVNLADAGILDPAAVSKAVVVHAIVSAGQALTVEVLVHRKDPPLATASL
jgi:chaperonin GroEL